MAIRRDHSEEEIETLATKFRESWSKGQTVKSWLRAHGEALRTLVRDEEWAWANIGKAMSRAGISFKTGNAWDGENLRRSVGRALKPRRGQPMTRQAEPVTPSPAAVSSEPEFRVIQRGPGMAVARPDRNPVSDAEALAIAQGHSKRGQP